jgi:general secretion pathway protein G
MRIDTTPPSRCFSFSGKFRRHSRGFSLLELAVVVSIIAVLATVALARLWALQVDAERVAMEQVLGILRSAIGMKVAESVVRNRVASIADLEGSNPMDLLAETPGNYLGVLNGANPASIDRGNWYFDATDRVLVYRVRNEANFTSALGAPARARFMVRVVRGVPERGRPALIEGVRLAPLESYKWVD